MAKDTTTQAPKVSKEGTAGQRKAAARARRVQQKRQQTYTIVIVMVVAVAVVILFLVYMNQPVEITMPENLTYYDSVPVSVTDQGLFRLGDPEAPVLMEEFSNFLCPHCADFHTTLKGRLVDPYIADGTLAVVFWPMYNSAASQVGAQAAICAGQQDPVKFWQMHDVLFSWLEEGRINYRQPHVEKAAERLGLDVGAFSACLGSQETNAVLEAVRNEAIAREIGGTPAIFFNGERPACGGDDPKCEGNLPYELVVQNIDRQLAGR